MSLPHTPPPTSPSIPPIGHFLDLDNEAPGETSILTGITLMIITLVALVHNMISENSTPFSLLVFTSFLMLLVLNLVNKGREIKFIVSESLNRDYLGRFAYRITMSIGLLVVAFFVLFLHSQEWLCMLTAISLVGLAIWNIKPINRKLPFTGTNSITNYWKRITGKAAFSQLDYGPGDTVRFSYEDALTRNSKKQYNVFLNRILESRFDLANDGRITWEREILWSAHQRVSPDQLSQGLTFGITVDSEETLTPSFYRLLYWEVILQEVDGSFLERFLVGVDQFRKGSMERAEALRA